MQAVTGALAALCPAEASGTEDGGSHEESDFAVARGTARGTDCCAVGGLLLALFFYNRSRPAPRGTYNDPDVRSSGSIGRGARAHDDPDVRSSSSIGRGKRAHDDPDHESQGSIGGTRR